MSVVGDRYAESLFDLAKEENKVTQYLDDIKLVGEVLDSDPQIFNSLITFLLKMIKRFNYWINHLKGMLINMF